MGIKAEDAGGSDAEEVGDGETDLRDMEFKLTHNLGQLQVSKCCKDQCSVLLLLPPPPPPPPLLLLLFK